MDPRLAIQVYTGPTATAEAAAEAVMHHLSEQQLRLMIADALYTGRMQGTKEGRRTIIKKTNERTRQANQTVRDANERMRQMEMDKDINDALLYSGIGGLTLAALAKRSNEEDEDNA